MRAPLAVLALVAALLIGGLTGELRNNEGLRARLAWEVLESGNWLVPSLYGEPHLTKPPGMPVLIALASLPVGRVTEETARLPSVFAGVCAIALIGWAVGGRAGWVAAAILPCSPYWLDRVPSAEIDLVQLAWVTGSLVFLLRAEEDGRFHWWLLALLCVAGGFFTKWTAPAFFYLTALPFLWWRGRTRLLLSRGHLIAVAAAMSLAFAWLAVVVQTVGWTAFREAVLREALPRLSPGHHPKPYPWTDLAIFPLGFIAGCLPWSLVALPSLRPSFGQCLSERARRLWQLALCWVVSSLVFWTIVPGHKARHILPAQPAVALLAVLVCGAWADGRLAWPLARLRPAYALASVLAVWVVVKLIWVGAVIPSRTDPRVDLRANAANLAQVVPPGETLHLVHLKDDCYLFYYGRPARRVIEPRRGEWCLLTWPEWQSWAGSEDDRQLVEGRTPLVLTRWRGHVDAQPARPTGGRDPRHRRRRRSRTAS